MQQHDQRAGTPPDHLRDLRPSPPRPAPQLDVRTSAAAERLHLLGVLVDHDTTSYDLGEQELTRLRERLGADGLAQLRTFDAGTGTTFHVLSLLAERLPSPAGIDELDTLLREDPAIAWRLLLAHHAAHDAGLAMANAVTVTDGDPDAVRAARDALAPAIERGESGATALLDRDPEAHGRQLRTCLEATADLWEAISPPAMAAVERDAEHRRAQLAAGRDVVDLVLDATNGYDLTDPTVERVVLLPSYWIRPWLVLGRRGTTEVLSTPVADVFLSLPPRSPPPTTVKLFKALADERRLTLLRRLVDGPVSLTEATEELAVSKATAHHHLASLRQAGLVVVSGEGRASRYALRGDPPQLAAAALRHYLGTVGPTEDGTPPTTST